MNLTEALEVVNEHIKVQQKNTVIDKDYIPQVGDILSNDKHSCITIEAVYELDKRLYRINKNFNDHLFKYEALKKIIRKKEIIWQQHKLDFRLFPNISTVHQYVDEEQSIEARKNLTYPAYCLYNDYKQYKRIYESKYRFLPHRKVRVTIGTKTMVRVNHGLCRNIVNKTGYNPTGLTGCYYWYGKNTITLGSLIAQQFVYRGNVYFSMNELHNES